MKIRSVGDELFHADRRTDKHDKANSRFSQILWKAPKNCAFFLKRAYRFHSDIAILLSFQKAVGIATYCGLDGPGIQFQWRRYSLRQCRPASRPYRPPIQRIPGLFAADKAAGEWRWRPNSRAEVENGLNYTSTSPLWFHWHDTE